MSRLGGDGAHLGALERVDEGALADIGVPDDPDSNTLCGRFVGFEQAEERGSGRRGEVGALMRGGGLEGEGRGRVPKITEPRLSVVSGD